MKKNNTYLYLGAAALAFVSLVGELPASQQGNAKTTKDLRGAGLGSVDTKQALSGAQGDLSMTALDSIVAAAPGNPTISTDLINSAKTDPKQMAALLERLEADIQYRDAMLKVLLADLEFVSLVLNNPELSAKYPKTAATLSTAVSS